MQIWRREVETVETIHGRPHMIPYDPPHQSKILPPPHHAEILPSTTNLRPGGDPPTLTGKFY